MQYRSEGWTAGTVPAPGQVVTLFDQFGTPFTLEFESQDTLSRDELAARWNTFGSLLDSWQWVNGGADG